MRVLTRSSILPWLFKMAYGRSFYCDSAHASLQNTGFPPCRYEPGFQVSGIYHSRLSLLNADRPRGPSCISAIPILHQQTPPIPQANSPVPRNISSSPPYPPPSHKLVPQIRLNFSR
ncbi:hypothetical protein F5Y15DRAFT_399691 [Xylariaceae sp. FL0016]|nr:hypothetical protein F5Y15DRAFT_399691 [Xylariaceae sp. FL0016]